MKIKFLLIVLVYALTPMAATASEDSSASTILEVVNDFVRNETRHLPGKVIIKSNRPDTRQTPRSCRQPQPFLPTGGRVWGKFSVGVRCQDEATWTLYVPVEIEVITRVVHAAQPVSMGKQLEAQDIVSKEADLVRIPGEVATDPDQVIGKVATTFLASGQPIRTHQLRHLARAESTAHCNRSRICRQHGRRGACCRGRRRSRPGAQPHRTYHQGNSTGRGSSRNKAVIVLFRYLCERYPGKTVSSIINGITDPSGKTGTMKSIAFPVLRNKEARYDDK